VLCQNRGETIVVEEANITLMDAARRYIAELPGDQRASATEIERFVRWCGGDRPFSQVRAQEVANYGETLSGGVTDAAARADALKKFFLYAKKQGLYDENLGLHLRLKKGSSKRASSSAAHKEIQISAIEKETMVAELEALKAQRPQILADIQRARADKDFRENAPLDAARERQGYVEGRIRRIEATLDRAVVVEDGPAPSAGIIDIGSTVVVRNLSADKEVTYTLVRPGEVSPADGRISFESPVGRALLGKSAGEQVDVTTPSGSVSFRVERIEE
jgi:transcription elongation factor GreA